MHIDLRLRPSLFSALRAPSRIGKHIQAPVSKTRARHLCVQNPDNGNQLDVTWSIFEFSVGTTSQSCSHPAANLDNNEVMAAYPGKAIARSREDCLGLNALLEHIPIAWNRGL
jgi:hypothetical protein